MALPPTFLVSIDTCHSFVPRKNFLEKKMLDDEIVSEVRAIREAHAARFSYNLQAIYEDLKKSESERLITGHPFVSPPATPPASHSVLPQMRFAGGFSGPLPPPLGS